MTALRARPDPGALRAGAAAAAIALSFCAPSMYALARGIVGPSESRLASALVSSFGGLTLPLAGIAVASVFFAAGSRSRARADRLVAAGASPRSAMSGLLATAVLVAALSCAVVGAIVVGALRVRFHLGSARLITTDVLGTMWALCLGGAAWTAIAIAFVARSGRLSRAWIVVAIDVVTRLLPAGAAWIAPTNHVANLLGAPPPSGFFRAPMVSQGASVVTLLVLVAIASAVSTRRYRGQP